jgi:hypothetical protein
LEFVIVRYAEKGIKPVYPGLVGIFFDYFLDVVALCGQDAMIEQRFTHPIDFLFRGIPDWVVFATSP